jgi:hypothetical protein
MPGKAGTRKGFVSDADFNNIGSGALGAAYLNSRSGATWSKQIYLKAPNSGTSNLFGNQVVLSSDGQTLAIGARAASGNATCVGGDQSNDSVTGASAFCLYRGALCRQGGPGTALFLLRLNYMGRSLKPSESVPSNFDFSQKPKKHAPKHGNNE